MGKISSPFECMGWETKAADEQHNDHDDNNDNEGVNPVTQPLSSCGF